jgi:acylphosphatase
MTLLDKTSARIVVSGVVQGVGFRYTAVQYARELNVTGTARNMPDGTVEMYVQGTLEGIKKLIENLEEAFTIKHMDIQYLSQSKPYLDFRILHD